MGSREIEYFKNFYIFYFVNNLCTPPKKKLKAFQNVVAIFKINSIY